MGALSKCNKIYKLKLDGINPTHIIVYGMLGIWFELDCEF